MTTAPQLRLRSVFDLLNERFFVPSYQRGYRWTPRQVEALLDDLEGFQLSSRQGSPDAFYCLQPVVVRRRSEREWEIVDGQQRLTTISSSCERSTRSLRSCNEVASKSPTKHAMEARSS